MSSISAGTTSTTTLIHSGDTTGSLVFKTNDTGSGGTTAVTIDTSQRAAFVAGTAALPAITTSGDTNTGIYFPAADTIAFAEGGTEAMRIDSSGNVGIGTSSPAYKLDVSGVIHNSLSSGNYFLADQGGTNTLFQQIQNSGVTLKIGLENSSGGGIFTGSGSFDAVIGTSSNRNLSFATFGSTKMTLDNAGNLLVGTTSASLGGVTAGSALFYSSANYAVMIRVPSGATNQALRFFNGSTAVGSVDCSGTATAYNTSSDYRLKENIAPMTGALAKVALLKPVTYKWKVDGSDGEGFIAHELAEVCPHAVNGEKDAVDADGNPVYQGIDTSFLVATLTAAIKELKAINDQQAETINALTARVVALEGQ